MTSENAEGARVREHGHGHGRTLIVLGAVLVAVALALAAYNVWDSTRAGQMSNSLLAQLDADEALAQENADGMPEKTVGGHELIGTLSLPSLGIELPVIANWDYEELRVAPCRYSGSYLTDDLVICGYNYSKHFGPLQDIAIGTDVYFESVDGDKAHYIVSNRETLKPADVALMIENRSNSEAAADWNLTLFTCDLNGQARCAVRCIEQ